MEYALQLLTMDIEKINAYCPQFACFYPTEGKGDIARDNRL